MGKANPTLWITLIFAALLVGGVLYMGTRGTPQTPTQAPAVVTEDQPTAEPASGTVQPSPESSAEADPVEINQGQGLGSTPVPSQPVPEVQAEPSVDDATPTQTPAPKTLVEAADSGDVERLRQLLAAGADVNAPTATDGLTPLMRTAKGGHLEAVFLLLDFGADPSRKDGFDKTASDHAEGHPRIVAVLEGASAPPAEPDPTK
jgi:hypothetical protein